jgi:hypothetical protein
LLCLLLLHALHLRAPPEFASLSHPAMLKGLHLCVALSLLLL